MTVNPSDFHTRTVFFFFLSDFPSTKALSFLNQSINLFAKYDNRASIINSGGRTKRQLTALTVALENHK